MPFTDITAATTADAMTSVQWAQELFDAYAERYTWWGWPELVAELPYRAIEPPLVPTAEQVRDSLPGHIPGVNYKPESNATSWYRLLQKRLDELLDDLFSGAISDPGNRTLLPPVQLHSATDGSRLANPLPDPGVIANPTDTPFQYPDKATFMQALSKGASSIGWRRTTVHPDDPAFSGLQYGLVQRGDIFGWWIIEDLQRFFRLCVATDMTRKFGESTYGYDTQWSWSNSDDAYWVTHGSLTEQDERNAYANASKGDSYYLSRFGFDGPGAAAYLYTWTDFYSGDVINYIAEGESARAHVWVDWNSDADRPARRHEFYWAPIALTYYDWTTMAGVRPDNGSTSAYDAQGETLPAQREVTYIEAIDYAAGESGSKQGSTSIGTAINKPALGLLDELHGWIGSYYGYCRWDVAGGFEYV